MPHFTKLAAAALSLGIMSGLFAGAAYAQAPKTDDKPPMHHEHKGKSPHDHNRFFANADANNDGFLTKDEMRAAHEKKLDEMFEKLDKDKDGKLSKDELEQGRKEMFKRFKKYREQGGKGSHERPVTKPAGDMPKE